jgi:hypothetical protein
LVTRRISPADRQRRPQPKKFIKLRDSACILVDKEICQELGWDFDSKFKLVVADGKLVAERLIEQ